MLARSTDEELNCPADRDPAEPRGRTSGGCGTRGPAQQLSEMARSLQAEPSLDQTLRSIVRVALVNSPGARHAGITVVDRSGRVSTPAATDELVQRIDRVQDEVGQGPCLDAIREQATVR